jgi:hypothetical protein
MDPMEAPLELVVEDIYQLRERGTVVRGTIRSGMVRVGDNVTIIRADGQTIEAKVRAIDFLCGPNVRRNAVGRDQRSTVHGGRALCQSGGCGEACRPLHCDCLRGVDHCPPTRPLGVPDPCSDRTAPSAAATHDHAAEHYQDYGTDDGRHEGTDIEDSVHGVIPCHLADDPAAQKGTDQTKHDVPDYTKAFVTFDEESGEPSGNCAHDEPCEPFHSPTSYV